MKNIGIVVAMNRESGILNLFPNNTKTVICGINFFEFAAGENHVVLATSGIGEIQASMATTILITHFSVQEILNYGYVGSLKHDLPVNVVVGVVDVVHTDMDLTAFGNAPGQYDEREELSFKTNLALTKQILGDDVYLGRLASADKFVSDGKVKQAIAQKFTADICDMEGAGIAVCASKSNISFALIKVVADGIEDDCTQTFFANSIFGVDSAIKKLAEYIVK